ncbi:MAG TPA: electron transfer flavoprotein subunit alpha/FixB family protein [Dehalococcoidales bacterium]|nr:electron transfer flavoprotein subunit alpha/FixB family protein [Dehalococcoidales bacterium]
MSEYQGVLVFCEVFEGRLTSVSLELLGTGRRLAGELKTSFQAMLLGSPLDKAPDEAIICGAEKVYVADDPGLKDSLTDSYLPVMEKIIKQVCPAVVLMGQTNMGRDLIPRLAYRSNSAAVLDCVALAIDGDTKRLLMTKPVFGGNAYAVQICETNPQFATIRAKSMAPAIRDESRKGEIIKLQADLDLSRVQTRLIERKTEIAGIKLEDARVIVCGGRGIGSAEGFKQLEELARVLKGAVGASRPACDNKWASDNVQIGLTGKIVSPELYIAVALSGSSQHLSGCSGSKVIVAINKDAEANIFKVAHYGIVADWKKAWPSFAGKVKELMK